MKLKYPLENQIRPRKRIRVADSSKADILSRPGTNAFRLKQRLPKRRRILRFRKRNSSAQYAPAEFPYGFSAGDGRLDLAEVGLRQDIGAGK